MLFNIRRRERAGRAHRENELSRKAADAPSGGGNEEKRKGSGGTGSGVGERRSSTTTDGDCGSIWPT